MADYYESRHTGQVIDDAVDRAKTGGALDKAIEGCIDSSEKGRPSGVATLGADALLAAAQRPKAGGLYRDDGTTTIEEALSEISTTLQKKADKSVDFTVTLTAAGWSDNAQTISNEKFVSAGYAYTVAPASGSFANYAEAMIYADDVTTNGQMVFHCDSVPAENLTVNIVRMVTAE